MKNEFEAKNVNDITEVISDVSLDKTILKLLGDKKYPILREILITLTPQDVAALFSRLKGEKLTLLFRLLPKELAAETFVEMDEDAEQTLIDSFSDSELKDVIDELYVDDAVDIIEEMPANVVKRILKQVDPDKRKLINEILKYPEDSAGSIMTTEYVSFHTQMFVKEAITRIRRTGIDKETIYTCYVLDKCRHLIGIVSVKDLLLSDEEASIGDIMKTNVISVTTTEDKEVVANHFKKYDFIAMPVVDDENRMVGIVTVDDAIDVLQEESSEDMEIMGAMSPSDKPYLKTTVFEIWKKRIVWLLFLMISATFTSGILNSFEEALNTVVALTFFVPMLMDTCGNVGGQSSVTVIKGLSLGELQFKDIFKVIFKEFKVSIFCGLTLSVVNFLKILILNPGTDILVNFVVSCTIFIIVILGSIVGCILPLLAHKLKLDPTVMASPLITTIVDAVALIVYFSVATTILPQLH